jgi:hypothetical protein
MPRVDAEIAYVEDIDAMEGRPAPRRAGPRPRRPRERWRRIAEKSQLPVIHDGMHALDQHSHDRETARRQRQMERRQ